MIECDSLLRGRKTIVVADCETTKIPKNVLMQSLTCASKLPTAKAERLFRVTKHQF